MARRKAPVAIVQQRNGAFALQHSAHIEVTLQPSIGGLHPDSGAGGETIVAIAKIVATPLVHMERTDMKQHLLAGAFATALLLGLPVQQAHASCRDTSSCSQAVHKAKAAKSVKTSRTKAKAATSRAAASSTHHRRKISTRKVPRQSPRPAGGGHVVAMIQSMAPSYGVPAWFALRIAKVESNYNPRARGSAGELGVFQLKCATARGIGYRGSCSGLLDARTNVQYGLKHLSLAMKSSGGNLRLAASKHNGGLGRRTMVYGYIAKVF